LHEFTLYSSHSAPAYVLLHARCAHALYAACIARTLSNQLVDLAPFHHSTLHEAKVALCWPGALFALEHSSAPAAAAALSPAAAAAAAAAAA
jgi:hypothetical protein